MFNQSSKDGQSAHFVFKNFSLTKPPFYVLLSSNRPIHAFKYDGSHNRYPGWDNCAARNRLGTLERNRRRFLPIKILYRVFPQSLQKKTSLFERSLACCFASARKPLQHRREREKAIARPRELIILHT
ncbi:hypothetical protein H4Q26_007888 [Puccinia striiformis f. sp. tritici PST-130]|uniref:Uncharacterized protein n=1 Tax=Puccinia striiformis f. sp. tritici PST-78 TaxID=1165861 RepID=A0A0L0VBH3_9BASI|nr:hypothetical protein H4Q26_007888 [Puccinia striiformis f. sp. tritici PST-130]KNE96662.1 hypothetical protein PSTG_10066 [Puccinia striiformis f. sp. tritici PST-78]